MDCIRRGDSAPAADFHGTRDKQKAAAGEGLTVGSHLVEQAELPKLFLELRRFKAG